MIENSDNYFFPELITICGSGRNVGKTILGENIIEFFSKFNPIVAIKISKFKYTIHNDNSMELLHKTSDYSIWKQLKITKKDSGRYLKAGASEVFYVECSDDSLLEVFFKIKNSYCENKLIVCESASITKYLIPGIKIFVKPPQSKVDFNKKFFFKSCDKVIFSYSDELESPNLFLSIDSNRWKKISYNSLKNAV